MLMAVDDSHKRNTVCLVPVLVGGVNVVDLPAPLRPLTCIELKEDLQNIEEIIRAISSKICLNCVILRTVCGCSCFNININLIMILMNFQL